MLDTALTVTDWLSSGPALMPVSGIACGSASSRIGACAGIGSSVGGSFAAVTVSVNGDENVCVMPPTVLAAVTVMAATPDRLATGVTVSVRAVPVPLHWKPLPSLATTVVLSDVATIESNGVETSPIRTDVDTGTSSCVLRSVSFETTGSVSTDPTSTTAAASPAPSRTRGNPR